MLQPKIVSTDTGKLKTISTHLSAEHHRTLKLAAWRQQTSISVLVRELLTPLLEQLVEDNAVSMANDESPEISQATLHQTSQATLHETVRPQCNASVLDDADVMTITVEQARLLLGVGRSTAIQAIKRTGSLIPGVPVLRVGRRYIVPTSQLRAALGRPEPKR